MWWTGHCHILIIICVKFSCIETTSLLTESDFEVNRPTTSYISPIAERNGFHEHREFQSGPEVGFWHLNSDRCYNIDNQAPTQAEIKSSSSSSKSIGQTQKTTYTCTFCCPARAITLNSNMDVYKHRCSQEHRQQTGRYRQYEKNAIDAFFSNSICHCGELVLENATSRRLMHLQSMDHLMRLHELASKSPFRGSSEFKCCFCNPMIPSSNLSLVWPFSKIMASYKGVVLCVINSLLTHQNAFCERLNVSLLEILMPDFDNIISFDPAFVVITALRRNGACGGNIRN